MGEQDTPVCRTVAVLALGESSSVGIWGARLAAFGRACEADNGAGDAFSGVAGGERIVVASLAEVIGVSVNHEGAPNNVMFSVGACEGINHANCGDAVLVGDDIA